MRKICTILLGVLLATSAMAIPAKKIKKILRLTDGTTVVATLTGDETLHYYVTEDGMPLMANEDGTYSYLSSSRMAQLKTRSQIRHQAANRRRAPRKAGARSEYVGSKKGLVVLVNFADKEMKSTSTLQTFKERMNKVGFNQDGHIGSVHDYFLAQSAGQFDLTFDVVGPVKLSRNASYYGNNDKDGNDLYAAEMAAEAIKLADNYVNFKDYDWDNDGEVDQVYLIYAGYDEAQSDITSCIWAHEWTLEEGLEYGDGPGILTLDGTRINTYACSSELGGSSGSTINGIGTCCHEFSHCLGLPDLYDTNPNGTAFGMDCWSLMDYGSYNENGCVPAAYTAYERMYAGWLTPTELKEAQTVSNMRAITDENPEAYIIYNKGNTNEYFVLQNIQKESWNKGAYGHGLLIIHVDYDENIWKENTVNNVKSHQRCTVVHADNRQGTSSSDVGGDVFPGTSKNTEFTRTSTPSTALFNTNLDGTKFLSQGITKIAETNGLISFVYGQGGNVPPGPEDPEFKGDNITFDFGKNEWGLPISSNSGTTEITQVKKNGATIDFTSGTTKTRLWNDYNTGTQIRIYKSGGTMSITAPVGRTIHHVDFTATKLELYDDANNYVANSSSIKPTVDGKGTYSEISGFWYAKTPVSNVEFWAEDTSNINTITLYLNSIDSSISAIRATQKPQTGYTYDLQGRACKQGITTGGLYIHNGKKILY